MVAAAALAAGIVLGITLARPGLGLAQEKKEAAGESPRYTVVFTEGYENPLIIEKSGGGGYLYGTTDLAAIRYRAGAVVSER